MRNEIETTMRLNRALRNYVKDTNMIEVIASFLYKSLVDNNSIEKIVELYEFASSKVNDEINEILRMNFGKIDVSLANDLLTTLINESKYYNRNISIDNTNDEISKLVFNLLNLKDNDKVFDLGSGKGYFLASAIKYAKEKNINNCSLIGLEKGVNDSLTSKLILSILSIDTEINIDINLGDILEKENNIEFDAGYVFPPLKVDILNEGEEINSKVFSDIKFTRKNTSEWIFIDYLLSGLKNNAKMVAIVTGKTLFSLADREYRKAIINAGLLEGIIELPKGALTYTQLESFILVFSKGNKYVKLLDVTNNTNSQNKRYVNVDLKVDEIIDNYNSENVNVKSIKELTKMENLIPSVLLLDNEKLDIDVKLEKVADVILGSQYTLSNFEEKGLIKDEETGVKILTSSEIIDGQIDYDKLKNVEYKKDISEKILQKGDIVLTSKSSIFKSAVFNGEIDAKILVTGAMIIVRPKENKLNSTYFKMFLDSKLGQDRIKLIQKGNTIVFITPERIRNLFVPIIDINEQTKQADEYNSVLNDLTKLKNKIKTIENKLANIFNIEK